MGHRFVLITSGARKADGNPHSPLESDELLVHQGEVDELAGELFELVASSRGIPKDDVEALQAASLRGQAALTAGLVDELGSFDDLIASLNTENVETEEMNEEDKVLALLRAMTEDAQLDEQSRSRARRALAAMAEAEAEANDEEEEDEEEEASAESNEDGDEDEEAEDDDDEEKAVSTATAGELAQRSATLERRLLKLERQHEAAERKRLIKAHGGVPAGLAAILNQKPLAEVKALLRELPKPRQPKLGEAAATTTIQASDGARARTARHR
jgi:hypothetical protein